MAIREGGWTDRMHTWYKIRRYSVGEHSWSMVTLAHLLFGAACSRELLLAILYHDVPERWVGDTPYTAKYILNRALGAELKKTEDHVSARLGIDFELTTLEKQILGFCDVLEFTLWCREEIGMGNSMLKQKYEDGITVIMGHPLWPEVSNTIIEMLTIPLGQEQGLFPNVPQ